ncbi:MAG TPA: NAD(P)-dependent alcohol dehydrogenase [Steroidobacteraceae bacterium]|nr:NAD(P)-dependent alcohol dehydrogenase [Steroidobacteraceae bacterium]
MAKSRIRKRIRWGRWILAVLVLAGGAFAFLISHESACPPLVEANGHDLMQAIHSRCYGPSNALRLERVARPALEDDMLLVRVKAAAVNPLDWHYMRGEPYVMRMQVGLGTPKDPRMGVDFSGTVEAVGKAVTRFEPGDEVFGGARGAFAEYIRVRQDGAIARKPAGASHEEAAALPVAASTALQALRDQGRLKAGEKVLVNGASGGVGTFAVQIAKAMGAEVTGVCSTRNVDLVASLGADRVLDYKHVDFVADPARYDLIVDTVGNRDLRDLQRVLAPGGIAVVVGGAGRDPWVGALSVPIKIATWGRFAERRFKFFIAELDARDLEYLATLMASGRLKPVIDRRYPLAETPSAVAYVEEGHARGKVIIDFD